MNSENLEKLSGSILLIEKTLEAINSDLAKLNTRISHENHKLVEDLIDLKNAVNEGYVDNFLIQAELNNIEKEAETLRIEVKEMMVKYYSKHSYDGI